MKKASELKSMTSQALNDELKARLRELFNLRMQRGSGQLVKPHLFKLSKKMVARIKTVLHQKKMSGES